MYNFYYPMFPLKISRDLFLYKTTEYTLQHMHKIVITNNETKGKIKNSCAASCLHPPLAMNNKARAARISNKIIVLHHRTAMRHFPASIHPCSYYVRTFQMKQRSCIKFKHHIYTYPHIYNPHARSSPPPHGHSCL